MIVIDINDQITPFTEYMLRTNSDWRRKLGKSLGYTTIGKIKRETKRGRPGGKQFAPKIPEDVLRKLNPKKGTGWLGRLVSAGKGPSAIGYEYKNGAVLVGWTSKSAARIGDYIEKGINRNVTPAMRRKWGRGNAEVFLKWHTKTLKLPERPIFEPAMTNINYSAFIEKKVKSYFEKGTNFANANGKRRKYKVYG